MYHVYIKTTSGFDSKKLVGEYGNIDKAYEKIESELAKNPEVKYILEETTGHVDSYGELLATVVEEN